MLRPDSDPSPTSHRLVVSPSSSISAYPAYPACPLGLGSAGRTRYRLSSQNYLHKDRGFTSCSGSLDSVGSVAVTGLVGVPLTLSIQPGSSKADRCRPPTKTGPLLPYTPGPLPPYNQLSR